MSRKALKASSAFTLVELLVVIGIIALLISILLPTLNKARAAAETTACLARLRDIGQSVAIYQAQYRGSYPPPNQWDADGTWGGSNVRGFTIWSMLGVKAGSTAAACPTALKMDAPKWTTANDLSRALYSYKYNYYLAGVDNPSSTALPHLPKARARTGTVAAPTSLDPNPIKSVKNSSETLMFVCYPQLVAFQTNDGTPFGTDRGMGTLMIKFFSVTLGGRQRQAIRSLAPNHGILRKSRFGGTFNDGTPALGGLTNVLYCDGSARTLPLEQGQFSLIADPRGKFDFTDGGGNGNIRTGNECLLEGTRMDPAAVP